MRRYGAPRGHTGPDRAPTQAGPTAGGERTSGAPRKTVSTSYGQCVDRSPPREVARPVFIDPRGGMHFDGGWQLPNLPEQPVEALVEQNRRGGIDPDAWTAGARWKRERDIPARVYFDATDAI